MQRHKQSRDSAAVNMPGAQRISAGAESLACAADAAVTLSLLALPLIRAPRRC